LLAAARCTLEGSIFVVQSSSLAQRGRAAGREEGREEKLGDGRRGEEEEQLGDRKRGEEGSNGGGCCCWTEEERSECVC